MHGESAHPSPVVSRMMRRQTDFEPTPTLRAPRVAYFSMEVGLGEEIPTYSGGLGILAGDTLRSAADLGVPMVGVTLLHRQGYFRQRLDAEGNQTEEPVHWDPHEHLEYMEPRLALTIEGRQIVVRCWRISFTASTDNCRSTSLIRMSKKTQSGSHSPNRCRR